MPVNEYIKKFSNEIYATKNDIVKAMKTPLVDGIWTQVLEYRSEFYEVLPIANYDAGDAEILVTSGQNYPDALSASATGKPVLLVGDELTAEQKDYLETLAPVTEGKKGATSITYHVDKFTIIGGTSAVNSDVKAELSRPAF